MEVAAQAANGRESVDLYRRIRPDVVLMDLHLPEMTGVDAIVTIRKGFPEARIIVITAFDFEEDIYRALQLGAKAYLLKDAPMLEITTTIRSVYRDEYKLSDSVMERLAERTRRRDLSQLEVSVLQLLTRGWSNKEIGKELCIKEDKVKAELKKIFVKLDVQGRTEAAVSAIRQGIINPSQTSSNSRDIERRYR